MLFLRSLAMTYVLGLAGFAPPAPAQVAAVQDAEGKRVFINDTGGPVTYRTIPVQVYPVSFRTRSGSTLSREQIADMARQTAEKHQVDPALVHEIIRAESGWNPSAVSRKGALGLMQLMPGTASDLGVKDPFDPAQNLDGGVRHLRAMLEKYDGNLDLALAAYNAGGGTVDRVGGVPNYRETRNYVQKIQDAYFQPGTGRQPALLRARRIQPMVDERGKRVFINE
jgi:hypothetical protein